MVRGMITRVGKFLSIIGEDGIEYIGFYSYLRNPKDKKHYCWKGNACTFTPKDEGGKHLVATDICVEQELDPHRFEKYCRKQLEQERHKKNIEQKAINKEKQKKIETRVKMRQEYEKEHLRYVIYQKANEKWHPAKPYMICQDLCEAKQILAERKKQNPQEYFQIRKKMVHQIDGRLIFANPWKK